MKIGNLIIYDDKGIIWHQSGEMITNNENYERMYPVGIPYMEVPYGSTTGKRIVSVDVSVTPHKIITEDIKVKPSYEDLENQLLLLENTNVEGGIF